MARWVMLVWTAALAIALSPLSSTAAWAEVRLALLIGNQDYPAEVGRLAKPHDDVALLEASLSATGFEVQSVLDADEREMEAAIAAFALRLDAAGPESVGFFYFSGHGASTEISGRQRNILLPARESITSAMDLSLKGVRLDEVTESLAQTQAKAVFIVSDACRNTLAWSETRGATRGFAAEPSRPGLFIAMSTSEGETAPDDGAFASALASEILKPGQIAELAFVYAYREVAKSRPGYRLPTAQAALYEDFYFAGRGDAPERVAALVSTPALVERVFRDCPDCPEMKTLRGGAFTMGSPETEEGRDGLDEFAPHQVVVAPFSVMRREVTVAQYRAFIQESGYKPEPGCWRLASLGWRRENNLSWDAPVHPQAEDHPVACINWHDASAFAAWMSEKTGKSYRLPTETEWEFAARAGSQTSRPWGDDPAGACQYANVFDQTTQFPALWPKHDCSDWFNYTAPAGSFEPNAFGLYDMIGNLSEWTADCKTRQDCRYRVLKGGAYDGPPAQLRSAFRHPDQPEDRAVQYGFRLVRDVE